LGNARTFLLNYLLARRNGWRMLLRVEDLDGPRVKPHSAAAMLDELAWLGLTWDGPVVYQTARLALYEQALRRLADAGMAYPCVCSRRDAESAASAPHAGEHANAYPGTCRGRFASAEEAFTVTGRRPAWRVKVDDAPIRVADEFAGEHAFRLDQLGGDFVIYKGDALAAYQLAVVVDDAAAGVDAIVRGDDLLESAARQIHLRRLLGLSPEPRYWHLPLVVGADGRRLAKRHGDTRLAHYRALGATPQRVLGLLGHWSGLLPDRRPADMPELLKSFDLARVPRAPVVFSAEDEAFLTGK
jgi:glutamyl-tRNA synthetase